MNASARLTTTPADVKLCALETITDSTARNFVLDIKGQYFYGFVVRKGNEVFGYVDKCPHMNLPLAQKLDDYLSPKKDFIVCSWHGAIFEIKNGLCVGGPCSNQTLMSWPVTVRDGLIVTV